MKRWRTGCDTHQLMRNSNKLNVEVGIYILMNTIDAGKKRTHIIEEYANGGSELY